MVRGGGDRQASPYDLYRLIGVPAARDCAADGCRNTAVTSCFIEEALPILYCIPLRLDGMLLPKQGCRCRDQSAEIDKPVQASACCSKTSGRKIRQPAWCNPPPNWPGSLGRSNELRGGTYSLHGPRFGQMQRSSACRGVSERGDLVVGLSIALVMCRAGHWPLPTPSS
jgi:hypothetical protein